MSDPWIVLVTIDNAPWDSDIEPEPFVFEFSGPDEARVFYLRAVEIAEEPEREQNILVFEPVPTNHVGNADDALLALREQLQW